MPTNHQGTVPAPASARKTPLNEALVGNGVEPGARRRGEAKAAGHGAIQDVGEGGDGKQRQRQGVAAVQDGKDDEGNQDQPEEREQVSGVEPARHLKRV